MSSPRNPPPRYGTPRNPDRKTIGGGVGKVMAALGNPPMPWQRDFLAVACEIDPATGLLWYRNVILILPRQGGKTSTSRGKITHRALTTVDALMLYTAQDRNKARKRLEKNFYNPLKASPLGQYLGKPRWQAGSEALRWTTGAELGIDAVGRKTGHGDTLTEAHIDEAYAHRDTAIEQGITPALITVPGSQKWITSAAGDTDSSFLWNKVEMGRALVDSGQESRTMFWEFSAEEGLDPEDPETALVSHPAIGHTITLDDVQDDVLNSTDKDDAYRAYFGWWPKPKAAPRVIPTEAWESNYVKAEDAPWTGTPFWTIDTSPDRETTSIAMAATSTVPGKVCYLELYEQLLGTAGAVQTMVKLRADFGGNIIALDGNGAAKSLRKDLEDEGFEVIPVTGPNRVDACGGFYDDALIGTLLFENDHLLNTSMGNAVKQSVGGRAWIFARNKTLADISGLYAVVFARWLFKEKAGDDYNALDSVL
jgi:phage terminase large subunit-like protein